MCACLRLTGAAEGLLGCDALVAGRAECGATHGERGKEVAVCVARLPLSRLSFSLSHPLFLLVLKGEKKKKSSQLMKRTKLRSASIHHI